MITYSQIAIAGSLQLGQVVVADQRGELPGTEYLISSHDRHHSNKPLCQFTVFICVLFILPTATPVSQLNMNYAIVAIGGIVIIVGMVWIFWGRFHFSGPVRTISQDHYVDEKEA